MAMITFHKMEDSRDPYFEGARELYEIAFPPLERRSIDQLKKVLHHPFFHAEVLEIDQKITGILFWWQLSHFRYIEHFTIVPEKRGEGTGSQVLEQFIHQDSIPIILEVEPEATTQEANRRIRFYQKHQFQLSSYPYFQPPYHPGNKPIPLQIMSYPEQLNASEFSLIVREIQREVY